MRSLEELWYSNIEPTEYDVSSCKEYKKLFEKYTDCVREHQSNTDSLIFQNGFKLGDKMMLELWKNR